MEGDKGADRPGREAPKKMERAEGLIETKDMNQLDETLTNMVQTLLLDGYELNEAKNAVREIIRVKLIQARA